jgi:hypothetical protein
MRGKLSKFFPFSIALICLASLFLAIGCGSSNARYRFVQAATALPNGVDLQVDGKSVQTAVGYGQTATYHSSKSGSHKFDVFPTGTTTNAYASASVKLSGDTTLIMQSTPAPNSSIILSPFTDDNTTPTTGNVKLRIIDSSASAGSVDVYVVQTGTSIGGLSPQITNMNFNSPAAGVILTLPAPTTSYDVIVTQAGTQNILNNLTGTYAMTALQIKTIVLLDASFGGGPFQQLVLNDLN